MTWNGWHIGWTIFFEILGLAAALSVFWALLGGRGHKPQPSQPEQPPRG